VQVHQFHPTVSFGDAVSNQILSLQRLLRPGGKSLIFCERDPIHFSARTRLIRDYYRYSAADNVLLVHFSLGYSAEVVDWLRRIPDRKVLVYHNITPAKHFAGVNEVYLEAARSGRKQLDLLRVLTQAGWGVSEYNREELARHGWTQVGVLPIVFDPKRYGGSPDRAVIRRFRDSYLNVLFVGRLSPSKRFQDLILVFYHIKRYVRPNARLMLVGSWQGMEIYRDYLQELVRRLGLSDVYFLGHVSSAELLAYYRCADVYLSMSEHEGFGVPLLESMYFGVPVVAYAAAAVPETMGGAGLLVKSKEFREIAELASLVSEDSELRDSIVSGQQDRVRQFFPDRVGERMGRLLDGLRLAEGSAAV
jgi:glycosyltransferase involved in cell wall biosynthesis